MSRPVTRRRWPVAAVVIGVTIATACSSGDRTRAEGPPVVHVAEVATLELPAVQNAPSRVRVLQHGVEPGSRPEPGRCAYLVLDSAHQVAWQIEASEAWEDTVARGDTTVVRHTAVGDYVPAYAAFYGLEPGQVIKVDCAAYGVLGSAQSGH